MREDIDLLRLIHKETPHTLDEQLVRGLTGDR